MIAVVQRVSQASVKIGEEYCAKIGQGLLILLGVSVSDHPDYAKKLASKIAQLRVFSDSEGKMNLSLKDIDGEAMVVSQFTLLADAKKGNRPSYIDAARPETAIPLYELFCNELSQQLGKRVETGDFGADMKVELLNDGPVTLVLDSEVLFTRG